MSTYDSYTVALLHFKGAIGSTSFIDEVGASWSNSGAPIIRASEPFGGRTCGYFNTSSYIYTANRADFDFGTGDFTLEAQTFTFVPPNYAGVVGCIRSARSFGWCLGFGNSDGKPRAVLNGVEAILSDVAVSYNKWVHLAIVRYGNTVTLYIDGVAHGTYDATGKSFDSDGNACNVGRFYDDTANYYYPGNLVEVRVSKGIARWTAAFTPPTKYYDEYHKYIIGKRDRFQTTGISLG